MYKLFLLLALVMCISVRGSIIGTESPEFGLEVLPELTGPEGSEVYAKKAVTAPLDLNDQISHALELVGNLVAILGTGAGSLAFELTGISLHDCSAYFKDKDVSEISCDEFLDDLSECESLGHIKPLLKSAKKRYQKIKGKAASSKNPCRRK